MQLKVSDAATEGEGAKGEQCSPRQAMQRASVSSQGRTDAGHTLHTAQQRKAGVHQGFSQCTCWPQWLRHGLSCCCMGCETTLH